MDRMDQIKPLYPAVPTRSVGRDKKRKAPLPAPLKKKRDRRPPEDEDGPKIDEYAL